MASDQPNGTTAFGTREQPIRVLCVDDSASIIALLKAILAPKYGFTVVGTAENGKIAVNLVKELKPDVVTLDIHMPELDGVSYMEHHFKKDSHPPVIMISSVAREETELAQRAIKAGASDYVEKPAFNNLNHHAEEIRTKIQMAHKTKQLSLSSSDFDKDSGKQSIAKAQGMVRVIISSETNAANLPEIFANIQGDQPPTIILIEGTADKAMRISKTLQCGSYTSKGLVRDPSSLKTNDVGVMPFGTGWLTCLKDLGTQKAGICVIGYPSMDVVQAIPTWKDAFILVEDLPANGNEAYQKIRSMAKDCMAVPSMGYMSIKLAS